MRGVRLDGRRLPDARLWRRRLPAREFGNPARARTPGGDPALRDGGRMGGRPRPVTRATRTPDRGGGDPACALTSHARGLDACIALYTTTRSPVEEVDVLLQVRLPRRVEEHSARNGDLLVEGEAQVRARPALTGRDGWGRMSEEEARQLANDISAALLALDDIPENDTAGRDVIEDALTLLRALRSYDKAVSNPER